MVDSGKHEHHTVTHPDAFGPLAHSAQKNLGGRRVGVLLEEMVLHLPHTVVAETICELDLIESVAEDFLFLALRPWPRQLLFIK